MRIQAICTVTVAQVQPPDLKLFGPHRTPHTHCPQCSCPCWHPLPQSLEATRLLSISTSAF